ncbi:MAG: ABC transporter permease subunit [Gammaproteobacteria bacterium]|nr:ABC transporter permease subunit [Gammaproteobacteria bacterium]MDH5692488.1 ABC transporter permease subunit [Gammaproteobacteria bacterium]
MSQANSTDTVQRPVVSTSMRRLKDRLTTHFMGVGGVSVIIAILLIFFYLLYVVIPLFLPASLERSGSYAQPGPSFGKTVHITIEEQNEIAVRWTEQGAGVFFDARTGEVLQNKTLPKPEEVKITSFAAGNLNSATIAYGFSNGQALVAKQRFRLNYTEGGREVIPQLEYPLGEEPVQVSEEGDELQKIAVEVGEESTTIVALGENNNLVIASFGSESDGLMGELSEEKEFVITRGLVSNLSSIQALLISQDQAILYAAHTNGEVSVFDIRDKQSPTFIERVPVVGKNAQVTAFRFLTGGISLLIGSSDGHIQQWFPVRREDSVHLTRIRELEPSSAAITDLVTEQRRKGFISIDAQGTLAVHHSTAKRTMASEKISDSVLSHAMLSPRADTVLIEELNGSYQLVKLENEHPDFSWSVLWEKIWYESYEEPGYVWQSSSASNDFEPKFSLMPLAFGTLKAAFYALLFAVPLALMGAIYTAYFMAPKMRAMVKPTIEVMEALPTVILGFLAGLWLAPVVESHLPGVFSLLIILPLGVLLFAYLWQQIPSNLRARIPDGWLPAILIPIVIALGWVSMSMSQPMEAAFFGGDMRLWLGNELGLEFDQRNSLVVGIAMGVAVIPTIFSIAEDAVFNVPKHLTFGSLALGATPWQTLIRVVILTASPGIFSAIMIGLGRAVGETMIVLMATGNTPVMDMSIFQGMRTLSANIAVEMPESEVGSTHYRILFLAALVLFLITFVFNTMAELVRQRLRKKYSSL